MFFQTFERFWTARGMQWLGRLATLGMLAVLAWLCARIFWSLSTAATPEPSVAIELDPARAAQAVAARHLFGEAASPAANTAVAQSSALPDITLRGVIAPVRPGQPAVAVLAIAGKASISVREGEEAMPGVSLHRVLARQVELKHNGQIQSLALPEKGKTGAEKSPGPASASPGASPQNVAPQATPTQGTAPQTAAAQSTASQNSPTQNTTPQNTAAQSPAPQDTGRRARQRSTE
jgi:hypothetical protein